MMNMLELIKGLCKKKGVSIHKLETDLGFGNGSLSKSNALSFDRVAAIANYFHVPIDYFLSDAPAPADNESVEKAMELYELYQNAIPEIQAAVESLLKSQR